jgi:hypothetical protein
MSENFTPRQVAEWKALQRFHAEYPTSADFPSSGIASMPLSPESEAVLPEADRPLCKVSIPPTWGELWAGLAGRFPRGHLETGGAPSAGAAAARPAAVAQSLPRAPQLQPLPSSAQIVVRNGGVSGINQPRSEFVQAKRTVDVSDRIKNMPEFAPVVKKGTFYFVQVDTGYGAQLAPTTRPRGHLWRYCTRPGGLSSARPERAAHTPMHTRGSLRVSMPHLR